MNIEARSPADGSGDGSSARHLAASAEPVFIFDGKPPVLVWANAAALAFLGHSGGLGGQLPQFDRAMPAMIGLRALADRKIPEQGTRTALVFWTPAGARSLTCHCRRATFAFAPEALIVHGAVTGVAAAEVTSDDVLAEEPLGIERGHVKTAASAGRARGRPVETQPRGRKAVAVNKSAGSRKPETVGLAPASALATLRVEPPADRRDGIRPLLDAGQSRESGAAAVATQPANADDAATLREIARQIRSATTSGSFPAPPEPPPGTPDFLSQIGHEIRTPLNSILGFAEIMREERFGPVGNARYKAYAADIHDSAALALGLISDLLDLSRIEASGLPVDPVEIDVADTISQVVAMLQPQAGKAGVVLSAPAGRPIPRLICDARSLKQMLINLVTNAVRQTDGGGAVWVTAALGDDRGLVVRVQDTGVGMSAEDIAVALQPYAQVGSAERRAGGTGLGLPLTKAMAEANGGRLVLERIAGGGIAALLVFAPDQVVAG